MNHLLFSGVVNAIAAIGWFILSYFLDSGLMAVTIIMGCISAIFAIVNFRKLFYKLEAKTIDKSSKANETQIRT